MQLEQETVARQLSTFDRPRSAIREVAANLDESSKQKWEGEREQKILDLRQIESKTFNLQRDLKHRARQHANEVAQLKFQLAEISAMIRQKEKQEINLAGL